MFYTNLIFILILTTYFYIQTKFLINFFKKKDIKILSDYDFKKPQSFHSKSIIRLGGILIFSSLTFVCFYLYPITTLRELLILVAFIGLGAGAGGILFWSRWFHHRCY